MNGVMRDGITHPTAAPTLHAQALKPPTNKGNSVMVSSLFGLQIVRGISAPKDENAKEKEAQRARRSEIERLSRQRRNSQLMAAKCEVARLEQLQSRLSQCASCRRCQ